MNRNLLYLSILFSAYMIAALMLHRWWSSLLALGAFAYLACVPALIPTARFVDPVPNTAGDRLDPLGQGVQWNYQFYLRDLGLYQAKEKLVGYLRIDGRDLADVEITVQGKPLSPPPKPKRIYATDYLAIPIADDGTGELTVSLRAKPGTVPRMNCGPEVHGRDIYSDAVWLEFIHDRESVLYHAKRVVTPAR
jgi:hypothetical protein